VEVGKEMASRKKKRKDEGGDVFGANNFLPRPKRNTTNIPLRAPEKWGGVIKQIPPRCSDTHGGGGRRGGKSANRNPALQKTIEKKRKTNRQGPGKKKKAGQLVENQNVRGAQETGPNR